MSKKGHRFRFALGGAPGKPPGAILERFSSLRGRFLEPFLDDFLRIFRNIRDAVACCFRQECWRDLGCSGELLGKIFKHRAGMPRKTHTKIHERIPALGAEVAARSAAARLDVCVRARCLDALAVPLVVVFFLLVLLLCLRLQCLRRSSRACSACNAGSSRSARASRSTLARFGNIEDFSKFWRFLQKKI